MGVVRFATAQVMRNGRVTYTGLIWHGENDLHVVALHNFAHMQQWERAQIKYGREREDDMERLHKALPGHTRLGFCFLK